MVSILLCVCPDSFVVAGGCRLPLAGFLCGGQAPVVVEMWLADSTCVRCLLSDCDRDMSQSTVVEAELFDTVLFASCRECPARAERQCSSASLVRVFSYVAGMATSLITGIMFKLCRERGGLMCSCWALCPEHQQ